MRRIVQNHERLGLGHPGEGLPDCLSMYPYNAYPEATVEKATKKGNVFPLSNQSKWRGLTEVVSIAALLHDIGHVPFGHTLEDEFSGIYERHDRLGGPRLYELLFNEHSQIKAVFGEGRTPWICGIGNKRGISNPDLLQLIYVILSWKEDVDVPAGFTTIIKEQKKKLVGTARDRVQELEEWYTAFAKKGLFQPFMSDIIGNTICADLLDYLPRDRMNLGMEYRKHDRLQRYLTIREGSLYRGEGKRVCIMVTRRNRGGQRRDVATAVLDIMRERYELVERVYYHHKKAAASAMLAKLAEIAPSAKPDDDAPIYPAPWTADMLPRHMLHFSDATFIDYLGTAKVSDELKPLQRKLYVGIRYDRRELFRTLLVVDSDIVEMSARPTSFFAKDLREDGEGTPSNKGRLDLEKKLTDAAGALPGDVLVYCPSPDMQSKEVDARLEIVQDRVLPLRVQRESFAYHADVKVLEQYYQQLWLIYIFVSPEVYRDRAKCKAIVETFCELYGIERILAYKKVRKYKFRLDYDVAAERALAPLERFFTEDGEEGACYPDTPSAIMANVIAKAAKDEQYLRGIKTEEPIPKTVLRIHSLFEAAVLEIAAEQGGEDAMATECYQRMAKALLMGSMEPMCKLKAARVAHTDKDDPIKTYVEYRDRLLLFAKQQSAHQPKEDA
jgi:HD superfamily phosphohydrolase